MKFGKLLHKAEENLPDIKHLSLRYKDLKMQLKELAARGAEGEKRRMCRFPVRATEPARDTLAIVCSKRT